MWRMGFEGWKKCFDSVMPWQTHSSWSCVLNGNAWQLFSAVLINPRAEKTRNPLFLFGVAKSYRCGFIIDWIRGFCFVYCPCTTSHTINLDGNGIFRSGLSHWNTSCVKVSTIWPRLATQMSKIKAIMIGKKPIANSNSSTNDHSEASSTFMWINPLLPEFKSSYVKEKSFFFLSIWC